MTLAGRRIGATYRWAACLLAVVWAGVPVIEALHAGAEQHRYCAVHAAMEESPSSAKAGEDGEDGEDPGETSLADPAAPRAFASGTTATAGHDTCAFARVCPTAPAHGLLAPGARALAALPLLLLRPGAPPPAPVPLITLAPKTSPPRS